MAFLRKETATASSIRREAVSWETRRPTQSHVYCNVKPDESTVASFELTKQIRQIIDDMARNEAHTADGSWWDNSYAEAI